MSFHNSITHLVFGAPPRYKTGMDIKSTPVGVLFGSVSKKPFVGADALIGPFTNVADL